MENPIKHCAASVMHTKAWNDMRARQAAVAGRGSGNKVGLKHAEATRKAPFKNQIEGMSHAELKEAGGKAYDIHMRDHNKGTFVDGPLNIKEQAYEKQNRKMRAEHKRDTGKTLGERQTKGTGKRRVSFACRFAGMKGSMKDKKGEPTRYAMALKKWGFGSREAARNFCNKNKEK